MANVIKYNNKDGESYYESVKSEIMNYASNNQLSCLELIDDGKESCVLKCISKDYGDVILKKRKNVRIIEDEFNTLVEYNGKGFCKAYDGDIKNGILLEEQIKPGIALRKVETLDKRLSIFCSLHKGLHVTPSDPKKYPTYLDWVSKITRYMKTCEDIKELYSYMEKAESICKELFFIYPSRMLLHGDLHHDNILQNNKNEYIIIDPKGVIGDPIFDIPRFILNEMDDELSQELYEKIDYIITVIGKQLNIPLKIIKQTFYIEMTMAECWNYEDGMTPCLHNVIFAERMLKGNDFD